MDSTATPGTSATHPQTNSDPIKTDDGDLRKSYENKSFTGNKYNVISSEEDSDDNEDIEDVEDSDDIGFSSDVDQALIYYHPDVVADRRDRGLEYDELFGWFRPGGTIYVNCGPKGVVFIDSEDDEN